MLNEKSNFSSKSDSIPYAKCPHLKKFTPGNFPVNLKCYFIFILIKTNPSSLEPIYEFSLKISLESINNPLL